MHGLSESRFNMWRAVVAMAHADEVVRPHEINFIFENTRHLPMTEAQRGVLAREIKEAASLQEAFDKITSPRDKEDFFHLARAICWSDGELDNSEEILLQHLKSVMLAAEDRKALKQSMAHFKDIFIDEAEAAADRNLLTFVKGVMGANTA